MELKGGKGLFPRVLVVESSDECMFVCVCLFVCDGLTCDLDQSPAQIFLCTS